jgi:hypothetical protein
MPSTDTKFLPEVSIPCDDKRDLSARDKYPSLSEPPVNLQFWTNQSAAYGLHDDRRTNPTRMDHLSQ